ncbi:MAG: hypothetical protein ACJ786_03420 [Catenulispora sp.]
MPASEPGGHLMHLPLRSRTGSRTARSGRIFWPTLAFLVGFAVLIYVVSDWYLLPALDAARNANTIEKRQLAAHARLLLAIVLVILICGIMLTFRFGRFFLPRPREPRRPTEYVDAWSESAKRMQTPPAGDDE